MSKAQESLIARRYAKAFFELAEERGKTSVIAKDIEALQNMPESPELCHFLRNPLVKREAQISVMRKIAEKAGFDALTANFLGVIAENGRLAILSQIVNAVDAFIDDSRGVIKAEVTSARKLSADQAKKLADTLNKATGAEIDIDLKVEESILGGLVIKLGSLLIDQSVKTRLDRLKRALKSESIGDTENRMRNAA